MLLDMDCKLVTKVIVVRLQGVAQQVLGEEQRGFVGVNLYEMALPGCIVSLRGQGQMGWMDI